MSANEPRAMRRQRLSLLAIFGLFLGPVAAAWLLYNYLPEWQPKATVNRGELVRPARPLVSMPVLAPDGAALPDDLLHGRWTLFTVRNGSCDEACGRRQYELRQIHLALNKDVARVRRVLLVIDPSGETDFTPLTRSFPDLHLARAAPATVAPWLAQFDLGDGVAPERSGRVFLIDPLGNLMMFYGPEAPAKGILKDLERLLRLSQIG